MRVLHVSTTTSGGAGLAALRLVEAQIEIGVDATLLTQERGVILGPTSARRIPTLSRLAQRGMTALDLSLTRNRDYFYSPADFGVLDVGDILPAEPDVVHIHNWFNFFPWRLASELMVRGISVVATAHDERIMTGGCHTTLGCDNYLEDCAHCPQSRMSKVARSPALRLHRSLIKNLVTVVSPSSWLYRRLLRRFKGTAVTVHEVPNCLDTDVFHPPHVERAGGITLGVMTGKANDLLQGSLNELVELLGVVAAERIALRVAGRASPPAWPGPVSHEGYLRSDAERADFFRACDIAIAPTHADNFPNVNLEAILSGAAVLTCDVGGSGEVIRATGRGIAVDGSALAMARGAAGLLASVDEMRKSAWVVWAAAKDDYGYETVAGKHVALYETVIAESNP